MRYDAKTLRDLPAYSLAEAAHYLRLPLSTLRAWALGQPYWTKKRVVRSFFRPVIEIADREHKSLSFSNLVEAHVLSAIRREHGVSLPAVRKALEYVRRRLNLRRPLIEQQFETDGVSLFVSEFGHLINVSRDGQLAIETLMRQRLSRIVRDEAGLPIKLFPINRPLDSEPADSLVEINPAISFGRPIIRGRGVPTAEVVGRLMGGDTIQTLQREYDLSQEQVEEAIRCELPLAA